MNIALRYRTCIITSHDTLFHCDHKKRSALLRYALTTSLAQRISENCKKSKKDLTRSLILVKGVLYISYGGLMVALKVKNILAKKKNKKWKQVKASHL